MEIQEIEMEILDRIIRPAGETVTIGRITVRTVTSVMVTEGTKTTTNLTVIIVIIMIKREVAFLALEILALCTMALTTGMIALPTYIASMAIILLVLTVGQETIEKSVSVKELMKFQPNNISSMKIKEMTF